MAEMEDCKRGKTICGTLPGDRGRVRVSCVDASSGSLRPGADIVECFRIVRELGCGGMGRVFLAEDLKTTILSRKNVVLKTLNSQGRQGEALSEMFESEVNHLAALNSDGIAQCYGAFMLSDGMPVLVMEYVEGTSLDKYLLAHGGSLDEATCRELLLPVAGALDYAHASGVYHLDVKPANIMVRKTPKNGAVACLLDFGIAKDSSSSAGGAVYGTHPYMAPESGQKPSPAMDVYSLAVTAYECLTGRLPYPDGWRHDCHVDSPGPETPFVCAVMRGLSDIPESRPENCLALVDPDLEELGRGTGTGGAGRRRRRFPPPPVENLRLACRPPGDGSFKVEWDWPEDIDTCMWAAVDSPVSSLEDVPEEARRWISRKKYDLYGGVVVPPGDGGQGSRSIVVFGVYVLKAANRMFASKKPAVLELVTKTISYFPGRNNTSWWRFWRRRIDFLAIKATVPGMPGLEIWAEGPRGKRRLMEIPEQKDRQELAIPWNFALRDGEVLRLRMPRGYAGSCFVEPAMGRKGDLI